MQQEFIPKQLEQFFSVLDSITLDSEVAPAEVEFLERFLELVIDLLVLAMHAQWPPVQLHCRPSW